jgi:hypothetical protein
MFVATDGGSVRLRVTDFKREERTVVEVYLD